MELNAQYFFDKFGCENCNLEKTGTCQCLGGFCFCQLASEYIREGYKEQEAINKALEELD